MNPALSLNSVEKKQTEVCQSKQGRLAALNGCLVYLNKVSDACWGPEDNPLVNRNGLLVPVFLDGDVSSEEQQRERRHFRAVVQEDLKGDAEVASTQ